MADRWNEFIFRRHNLCVLAKSQRSPDTYFALIGQKQSGFSINPYFFVLSNEVDFVTMTRIRYCKQGLELALHLRFLWSGVCDRISSLF